MFTIDANDDSAVHILMVKGFSPEDVDEAYTMIESALFEARRGLRATGELGPGGGPVIRIIALADHQELLAYAAVPADELDTMILEVIDGGEEE